MDDGHVAESFVERRRHRDSAAPGDDVDGVGVARHRGDVVTADDLVVTAHRLPRATFGKLVLCVIRNLNADADDLEQVQRLHKFIPVAGCQADVGGDLVALAVVVGDAGVLPVFVEVMDVGALIGVGLARVESGNLAVSFERARGGERNGDAAFGVEQPDLFDAASNRAVAVLVIAEHHRLDQVGVAERQRWRRQRRRQVVLQSQGWLFSDRL